MGCASLDPLNGRAQFRRAFAARLRQKAPPMLPVPRRGHCRYGLAVLGRPGPWLPQARASSGTAVSPLGRPSPCRHRGRAEHVQAQAKTRRADFPRFAMAVPVPPIFNVRYLESERVRRCRARYARSPWDSRDTGGLFGRPVSHVGLVGHPRARHRTVEEAPASGRSLLTQTCSGTQCKSLPGHRREMKPCYLATYAAENPL